jgi:peptidoglycan/LPS O-acetylase OafA/YrhL
LLLELARGLAALWVFIFHVKEMFISSPLIYSLASFGSLGVPMFFVISGYVITYSAESNLKNKNSPFVFLKSRFLRIYPAFWASVLVVLLFPFIIELISSMKSGEFLAPPNLIQKYNFNEWVSFLSLTKVFSATSSDLQSEFNAINSVYWTLAIEFQFYCMVYFALLFKNNYRLIIIIVTLISFAIIIFPSPFKYGLFIHYWSAFSIGIALAYLHKNNYTFSLVIKGKIAAFFVLCISLIIIFIAANHTGPQSIFFAAAFALLIWVISDFESVLAKVKNGKNKALLWFLEAWLVLGTMSYTVYLLHGKIYVLPAMFSRQIFDSDSLLFGISTIIGTLFLCYPFYYFVERRFLSKNYKSIQEAAMKKL